MSKDLFSSQSSLYAAYRPRYPAALYEYLFEKTPLKQHAWDCATGNGQVAEILSAAFHRVSATDISASQLAHAQKKENIEYSVQPAEHTRFPDKLFNLITVAQAYHWFDFDAFKKEAERVSQPGCLLAVWGYHLPACGDTRIDSLLDEFYTNTTHPYWDPERQWIDERYETIPFPFADAETVYFTMSVSWTAEHFAGYLRSWSAVQHFIRARGFDPVDAVQKQTDNYWPAGELKEFSFPLFMKTGRTG